MITRVKTADHQEWLSLRANYIGGSDAAAILGLNPYKSAYALWAEKTGKVVPFEGNIVTRTGAYLEQFVAQLYMEETGRKVRNENRTFFNSDYPWACANVDRLIVGQGVGLEIKTTNDRKKAQRLERGEIPNDWLCQMTHYMALTGLQRWELAALVGCRELHILTMERNEGDIKALMGAEENFWGLVQSKEPPGIDGATSTAETLDAMFPESEADSEIGLEPVSAQLSALIQLKAEKKTLEEQIRAAENAIKEYMEDVEYGTCGGVSVSWKSVCWNMYDTKGLCRDHPNLMEQYRKTSACRRFTVKGES